MRALTVSADGALALLRLEALRGAVTAHAHVPVRQGREKGGTATVTAERKERAREGREHMACTCVDEGMASLYLQGSTVSSRLLVKQITQSALLTSSACASTSPAAEDSESSGPAPP